MSPGTRTQNSPTAQAQPQHTTNALEDLTTLSSPDLSKRICDLTQELNRLSKQMWDRRALPDDDTYQEKDRVRRLRSACTRELHRRGEDLISPYEALWTIHFKDADGIARTEQIWSEYFASKPGWNGHGTPTTNERINNLRRAETDFCKANPGVAPLTVGAVFVRSRRKQVAA